ncbi:hypothetical protein [Mesoflavibacter sp. CH_XMU1422-2]|uniref:hypothetical protein n=1 Tax=Mesoflavibacter sp. CH_XMU1422-2 TaxID=3107770 RepID=UPI00300BE8B4
MGKKKKHIINWNIITLITTSAVVIISIVLNYNQREIDILQSELTRSENRIKELESELDPSWHIKYNNQKDYYESEIKRKELLISEKNEILTELESKNGLVLSKEQKVEIVKTLMAYPKVLEKVKLLEEINNSSEKIIEIQKEMLAVKNSISEKEKSRISKSNTFLNIILVLFGIAGLFSAFMVYKKSKK